MPDGRTKTLPSLVDPPGRLGQYVARHHLRNQDEAPLGELVDLPVGQHVINVGGRHPHAYLADRVLPLTLAARAETRLALAGPKGTAQITDLLEQGAIAA
jgi:hypothetical protein